MVNDLRTGYHRALEICDSFSRYQPEDKGATKEEPEAKEEKAPQNLELAVKAKPPEKPEPKKDSPSETKVKIEEEGEEKPPVAEVTDESKVSKKEKKARERGRKARESTQLRSKETS